jgi:hypothetical protein
MDPGAASPIPATIADVNLATIVLIVGVFFIVVGLIIAGVVYRESREWKKLVLPMFDRVCEMTPESFKESDNSAPRMATYGKEIFARVFSHMDVAGLLGGAAVVILGVLVVFISVAIGA